VNALALLCAIVTFVAVFRVIWWVGEPWVRFGSRRRWDDAG
jgi:hypothetical protein